MMKSLFFNQVKRGFTRAVRRSTVNEEALQEAIKRFNLAPPPLTPEERARLKKAADDREEALKTAKPIRELTEKEMQAIYDGLTKHEEDKSRGYIY